MSGRNQKGVAFIYPLKRAMKYKLVLVDVVDGKVKKRSLWITADGIVDASGNEIKISTVTADIRKYIADRTW